MKIQHLGIAEAYASLNGGPSGLNDAEAKRRLAELGRNQMEEIAHDPLLLTFAKEFAHFFAIILWVAAGLAFFAEWNQPGQGMATLGGAVIGVIVINGVFSFWQAYRAEQALAVLKQLLPRSSKVLRAGTVRQIPAAELVPGDLILLESGDILPADCRLVEAFGVRVNNATITGESMFPNQPQPLAMLHQTHPRFYDVAAFCHDLKKTEAGWLGDPMEIALVSLAESATATTSTTNHRMSATRQTSPAH